MVLGQQLDLVTTMEPNDLKTVLIAGDLLQQVNLAPDQVSAHESLPELTIYSSSEGVWSPASLVKATLADPEVRIITQPVARELYVFWGRYPRQILKRMRDQAEPLVWRICRPLGLLASPKVIQPPQNLDPRAPDVLLIDDVGLGFSDDPACWPGALREGGDPRRIIWRRGGSLGNSVLARYLFERYADRLTIILSVNLLRTRGADISAPLSWDLTIEQIAKEFESGTSSLDLARARRVIVTLGTDGAASFTRIDRNAEQKCHLLARAAFERCVYDPCHLEGAWENTRPGSVVDTSSLIAVTMVRHDLSPEIFRCSSHLGGVWQRHVPHTSMARGWTTRPTFQRRSRPFKDHFTRRIRLSQQAPITPLFRMTISPTSNSDHSPQRSLTCCGTSLGATVPPQSR